MTSLAHYLLGVAGIRVGRSLVASRDAGQVSALFHIEGQPLRSLRAIRWRHRHGPSIPVLPRDVLVLIRHRPHPFYGLTHLPPYDWLNLRDEQNDSGQHAPDC